MCSVVEHLLVFKLVLNDDQFIGFYVHIFSHRMTIIIIISLLSFRQMFIVLSVQCRHYLAPFVEFGSALFMIWLAQSGVRFFASFENASVTMSITRQAHHTCLYLRTKTYQFFSCLNALCFWMKLIWKAMRLKRERCFQIKDQSNNTRKMENHPLPNDE